MLHPRRFNAGDRFHFSISQLPFYYGWVVLIVGALGILASIPGQTMGVSVFTDHLMDALKISRVGISTAYMIGTLASSLLIPFAGILFDKWGARLTGMFAALFLSLFLLLLAFSPSLVEGIVSIFGIPPGIVATAITVVGFFGIRFFGQGVLTLVSRGMIARWFGPRRGLVVGLLGLATAFGFSYAPRPLQALILEFGWRGALVVLAAFLGLIFMPLVILFYRSEPMSCGLEVEQGMPTPRRKASSRAKDADVEKTAGEAKKETVYWVILIIMGYWSLFNTAFTFHIVSIFNEIGMDANTAVKIFFPISVISVIARFLGSYLSDRIAIRHIYLAFVIALMIASASLASLASPIARFTAIVGYGIGSGLFGMLNIVTWPKLYGKKHLGAISGFAMSILVAGSAVGPWLFSLAFRFTDSYRSAGIIGLVCSAMFLLALLLVKFPNPSKDSRLCPGEDEKNPLVEGLEKDCLPCERKIG
ncbi:MAG: MFS transporter [Sphaerochaeta sp.]|jgi:MFS family permease|nr:MFS transporter [Sphaerochaeta sp.]PKL29381.1 MAG: MFS transporter [Spirochaetae bacterium HGW-Spirochaetae-2]